MEGWRAWLSGAALAGVGCLPASGQSNPPIQCRVSALPPTVHADGIAEPVAEIVLACTAAGGAGLVPAAAPDLRIDLTVALNASVTNRLGFGVGGDTADAVLTVNGNDCPEPGPAGSVFGACGAPSDRAQDPQYGRLVSVNRLSWTGVALPVPGALRPGGGPANPAVATLSIRGVRANASQLRLAGGGSRSGSSLVASVSIDSPGVGLIVEGSPLPVAYPATGLVAEPLGDGAATSCLEDGNGAAAIRLQEGFPGAFRAGGPGPGGSPTRILLDFQGIPDGTSVSLPGFVACHQPEFGGRDAAFRDALSLGLVQGHDGAGAGGASGGQGTPPLALPLSEGAGQAVYEVLSHDPGQVEDCRVPIAFQSESLIDGRAHGRITASLAPLSAVFEASADIPAPRYAAVVATPESRIDVAACRTTLLFPFVTNQTDFDTSLVITHGAAGASPEARPRSGACDLHYFGDTSDNSPFLFTQHSTAVSAADQLVMTVSEGNPERNILGTSRFEGYVMAVCGFPAARGYANIRDGFGGTADLAMGYLAPVVAYDSEGSRIDVAGGSR